MMSLRYITTMVTIKATKNKPAKIHWPFVNMLKSFLQMYNRPRLFLANFRSQIIEK